MARDHRGQWWVILSKGSFRSVPAHWSPVTWEGEVSDDRSLDCSREARFREHFPDFKKCVGNMGNYLLELLFYCCYLIYKSGNFIQCNLSNTKFYTRKSAGSLSAHGF